MGFNPIVYPSDTIREESGRWEGDSPDTPLRVHTGTAGPSFFLRIRYTGFKHLKDLEIPPRLALAGLVEWKPHNLPAHPFFTPKIALEGPRLLD